MQAGLMNCTDSARMVALARDEGSSVIVINIQYAPQLWKIIPICVLTSGIAIASIGLDSWLVRFVHDTAIRHCPSYLRPLICRVGSH